MRSRFAAIAVFLGIAATVRAVDTAYWTEYAADPKDDALFLLMPFTEDLKKAAGSVVSVEAVGDVAVVVHNYWADRPALRVANDEVKWIVLERKDRPELLMIFASWSDRDAETAVSFLPGALGFDPAGLKMSDAEGGAAASFPLALPGPYGVRLIRAGK